MEPFPNSQASTQVRRARSGRETRRGRPGGGSCVFLSQNAQEMLNKFLISIFRERFRRLSVTPLGSAQGREKMYFFQLLMKCEKSWKLVFNFFSSNYYYYDYYYFSVIVFLLLIGVPAYPVLCAALPLGLGRTRCRKPTPGWGAGLGSAPPPRMCGGRRPCSGGGATRGRRGRGDASCGCIRSEGLLAFAGEPLGAEEEVAGLIYSLLIDSFICFICIYHY